MPFYFIHVFTSHFSAEGCYTRLHLLFFYGTHFFSHSRNLNNKQKIFRKKIGKKLFDAKNVLKIDFANKKMK